MSRRRDLETSEFHHLGCKGADGQDIFSSALDFDCFETTFIEETTRHDVQIHALCLMTNHVHALVRCIGGLSDAMRSTNARYASKYNWSTDRTGPLFTGPFWSRPVPSEQLHVVGRYIHRNPIAFTPAKLLGRYRYSTMGAYTGDSEVPAWLHTSVLGAEWVGRGEAYRCFVSSPHRSDSIPFGPAAPLIPTSTGDLLATVCDVVNVDPASLARSGKGITNAPRILSAMLALRLRVTNVDSLLTPLGIGDVADLRRLARRGRVLESRDERFAVMTQRVLDRLAGVEE